MLGVLPVELRRQEVGAGFACADVTPVVEPVRACIHHQSSRGGTRPYGIAMGMVGAGFSASTVNWPPPRCSHPRQDRVIHEKPAPTDKDYVVHVRLNRKAASLGGPLVSGKEEKRQVRSDPSVTAEPREPPSANRAAVRELMGRYWT